MRKKAFTIVELIVVIIILAILSTISFIAINSYTVTTRDAKRYSDITELYGKIDIKRDEKARGIEDLMNTTST
jgi:prepilin-type N-terminal cleavage/methylation domain-containing protein